MKHYETCFFVEGKIRASMGVNALRIQSDDKYSYPTITIFYEDGQREKFERIAAAINEIMNEDAAPADVAQAAE